MISRSSPLMANSFRSANSTHVAGNPCHPGTQYVVVQQPYAYDAVFEEKPNTCDSEIQEIAMELEKWQLQDPENHALNFEVVDDTALIDSSLIGIGKFNRNNSRGSDGEKKPKCRGGKGRKKKMKILEEGFRNDAIAGDKEAFLVYSREEMEALRFGDLDEQKKKWATVYCALDAAAAAEYDGLVASADGTKKIGSLSSGFDRLPFSRKSANSGTVGRRNYQNVFVHFCV